MGKLSNPVNHFATVKSDMKWFVDGTPVSPAVRSKKLYVERVNSNGTISLADDQTTMTVGCSFADDVTVHKETRTYHDTNTEHPDISMRIMGVPSRMENILLTKSRFDVPDNLVFIDEKRIGCVENAKRAWLAENDKPFTMVVQDDVEFCDDFFVYANKIAQHYGNAVISFFPYQFIGPNVIARRPKSPYVLSNCVSGVAVMMPTKYVEDCINYWSPEILGDDTNISRWASDNGIKMITTVPSLVQHLGQISVFSPGRSLGRAYCYRKNPEADFDNDFLNHWSNIS